MAEVDGRLREFVGRGRARHKRLMLDSVAVARISRGTLNTTTGQYATTSTPIYTGYGRIKREMSRDQEAAGGERQAARLLLVLPYGATGAADLAPGDVVTVSASLNADLVGATLTVVGAEQGSTASAHRYIVEDVA